MPEVIDLCLDSSPLPLRSSRRITAVSPRTQPAQILISDDSDNNNNDGSGLGLPARKRMRASTSPASDKIKGSRRGNTEISVGVEKVVPAKSGRTPTRPTRTTKVDSKTSNKYITASQHILDPIIFTSSPALVQDPLSRLGKFDTFSSDSDAENGSARGNKRTAKSSNIPGNAPKLSSKTANILAGLRADSRPGSKGRTGNKSRPGKKATDVKADHGFGLEEGLSSSSVPEVESAPKPAKARLTAAEKEALAASKAAKQAEKEAAKTAKAEQKLLKAQQTKKDAEIAEVNKRKSNKKDTTPEMIVDLPRSIESQTLGIQTCQFLENVGARVSYWDAPSQDIIVRWRRKVVSRFNEEYGYREPIPETIQDEKHILLILPAKEFVALASAEPQTVDRTLDSYIEQLKSQFSRNTLLVLIEGLQAWKNKSKTLENRAFRSGVLSQLPDHDTNLPSSSQSTSRKTKKKPTSSNNHTHVPNETIEEALLRLQVIHALLIHHTAHPLESAEWISHFTQHISTIPYKLEAQRLDTAFCMETGQITTGRDPTDTYIKMLQEIVRVTPPVAMGIQRRYSTVYQLVRGLNEKGPLALEDVEKVAAGGTAVAGSRIGPALSKRIWKIFTGLDPDSNDGVV